MKTVNWERGTSLDEVLRPGEQEEVLLVKSGHAVALMIPFDDEDLAWYARERDPAFINSIATARQQVAQGRTVSHRELKRKLGLDSRAAAVDLDFVLDRLNQYHQRATYGAVAGVVGATAQSVMQGRPRDRRHSWVVRMKDFQPSGYEPSQKHVALEERSEVISDVDRLRDWLRHPQSAH